METNIQNKSSKRKQRIEIVGEALQDLETEIKKFGSYGIGKPLTRLYPTTMAFASGLSLEVFAAVCRDCRKISTLPEPQIEGVERESLDKCEAKPSTN